MNQEKVDEFAERLLSDVNASLSCLNLYLGNRLGLFEAMSNGSPVTPAELAERAGCDERYTREWLECLAASDYLSHEPATGRFSLPPEHGAALLDKDNPSYAAPFLSWTTSLVGTLPSLMEAFRSGGGVPYEAYGNDALEAIGMGNRPMFVNDCASQWIPAMPDVHARMTEGARVADIGCGLGWSSISLAKGFPNTRIDALDLDAASIEQARCNAEQAGVADRITFHLASAEEANLDGPFDLITAFECIHDLAYPVQALRRMRELAGPQGAVLVSDELVGDGLEENRDFYGRFMYNFSVLHCLPQAMVFEGSAGTGTVMGPSKLTEYAQAAGFAAVDTLPIENPFWRFYRLTP